MRGNFITDRSGVNNPNYKHGKKDSRIYSIYRNILTRCFNQNSDYFHRYGGRGITVCDEWKNDFQAFYDWSMSNGYVDDLTIDRIDNNGNYEPDNCQWVTMKEQAKNRISNHYVTIKGTTKTLFEWCEIFNINYRTVQDRIRRGWDEVKALKAPVQTKHRKKVV